MKRRTKLYRNLKPGDRFIVETDWVIKEHRTAVVTVSCVKETYICPFTSKRQWRVLGNYPWWFSGPIHVYSDERVELCVTEDV